MSYAKIFEEFPSDLRVPIARLVDALKEEFGVRRTDFDELKELVRDLAEAQKRTEDELTLFRRTFTSQIGGLGARWGLQTEEAFRQGVKAILQEIGFTVERFLESDQSGEVFGHPDQIELDVVIKNGRLILIEIKASVSKSDVYYFERKTAFYTRSTGRKADRRLIITPYAEAGARETGVRLGVEICTDINALD